MLNYSYLLVMFLIFTNVACINASSQNSKKEVNLDYIEETLENYEFKDYKIVEIQNSKQLITLLKDNKLWDFESNEISHVLIKNFPSDFHKLRVKDKKRAFFHSMISMILVVSREIRYERSRFIETSSKYPLINDFNDNNLEKLKLRDKMFMAKIIKKYKATEKKELLKRIDVLPVSLVLSQTAIESAWGTSRFTLEGNNLFGVWSYNGKGLIPKRRRRGLKHRVAIYDSLLDSVRDYMLKINTVKAYRKLRNLRQYSKNSIYLTKGLIHYSERKGAYIKDLQRMINKNKLKKYDNLHLKGDKI